MDPALAAVSADVHIWWQFPRLDTGRTILAVLASSEGGLERAPLAGLAMGLTLLVQSGTGAAT